MLLLLCLLFREGVSAHSVLFMPKTQFSVQGFVLMSFGVSVDPKYFECPDMICSWRTYKFYLLQFLLAFYSRMRLHASHPEDNTPTWQHIHMRVLCRTTVFHVEY